MVVIDPFGIRRVPEEQTASETRLDRLKRLAKLGQRALVEQCDRMSVGQAAASGGERSRF